MFLNCKSVIRVLSTRRRCYCQNIVKITVLSIVFSLYRCQNWGALVAGGHQMARLGLLAHHQESCGAHSIAAIFIPRVLAGVVYSVFCTCTLLIQSHRHVWWRKVHLTILFTTNYNAMLDASKTVAIRKQDADVGFPKTLFPHFYQEFYRTT